MFSLLAGAHPGNKHSLDIFLFSSMGHPGLVVLDFFQVFFSPTPINKKRIDISCPIINFIKTKLEKYYLLRGIKFPEMTKYV